MVERITITHTDDQGRERKVVITNGGNQQPDFWRHELCHPDGQKWTDRIHGNYTTAIAKAEAMLNEHARDFVQARGRGDRPPQRMLHDRNVAVSDLDPQLQTYINRR
jgi:hypothetical protein